mmetsp:Transcript_11960/g.25294  ORF Transcript_11960/g.25294 Transcript_11960/m.25294 type:complete len:91 (-) Transcript_11960:240-512(-)
MGQFSRFPLSYNSELTSQSLGALVMCHDDNDNGSDQRINSDSDLEAQLRDQKLQQMIAADKVQTSNINIASNELSSSNTGHKKSERLLLS